QSYHYRPLPRALHTFPTRRSSDLSPHQTRIAETHICLRRMDIDVHHCWIEREEQNCHRMAVTRQHIGIGAPDRAGDQLVANGARSEEHTSELQSREDLVCRLLLEK